MVSPMVSPLLTWANSEARCTPQFLRHLQEMDVPGESRWEEPFPIHCLLRFTDEELPSDVKGPAAARAYRLNMANVTQQSVVAYLKDAKIPYDSLWLINAVSVRLPRKDLLSHLTEL